MYYPNHIEEVCFNQEHIESVTKEIEANIPAYFQNYMETDGGGGVSNDAIAKLAEAFRSTDKPKSKKKDHTKTLNRLIKEALNSFESDRESYQDILNIESLEEYKHDVGSFKNTILKNQIPIIRKTIQNKAAKELDKYRVAFKDAQPGQLFEVVNNIIRLAEEKKNNWYNEKNFEKISDFDALDYHPFDDEACTAFGVIGGGIKSHFLYKLYPFMFSNRSRESVWALWYLSGKKKFDCKEDSEFLMINQKESTTQQNYFYKYGLFSFYTLKIFLTLKELFKANGVDIPTNYRFVIVDHFMSFVAAQHQSEINLLKSDPTSYEH